jgi:exosortase/archaeosortase family protein
MSKRPPWFRGGARGRGRERGPARGHGGPAPRPGATRRPQLRFVLVFLTVALLLFSIYSFPYAERGQVAGLFERYLAGYARLAGWCLRRFDPAVEVRGALISGRFSLHIVKSCDAMEANLLFVSAVAAWPAPWRRRVLAGGLGVVFLVLLNILRICTLYAIGIHVPGAFPFFHIDLWPLLLVLAAGGAFIAAALWMQRSRSPSPLPPPDGRAAAPP